MKTKHLLVALLAYTAALLHAADPVGIDILMQNPASFAGREILVEGHVDRVSAARRMVVLIDTTEADCQDACGRKSLVVQIPETLPIPEKGTNIQVTGSLSEDQSPSLLATAIDRP
jgi:hypothetical protein